MPFLREECQLDMRLEEVRIDAKDMEHKQPRQTHKTANRGIEFYRDRGIK